MTKVYQRRVCPRDGDCAQAAIASLFELEIEEVPDFVRLHGADNPQSVQVMNFIKEKGYEYPSYCGPWLLDGKPNTELLIKAAKFDEGINGYFYATVQSQTYKNVYHAVVVDTDLNIVHDPNPNEKCLVLKPEDVQQILTVKDFIVSEGKIITDWRKNIEDED
jgi:hypothetical protein